MNPEEDQVLPSPVETTRQDPPQSKLESNLPTALESTTTEVSSDVKTMVSIPEKENLTLEEQEQIEAFRNTNNSSTIDELIEKASTENVLCAMIREIGAPGFLERIGEANRHSASYTKILLNNVKESEHCGDKAFKTIAETFNEELLWIPIENAKCPEETLSLIVDKTEDPGQLITLARGRKGCPLAQQKAFEKLAAQFNLEGVSEENKEALFRKMLKTTNDPKVLRGMLYNQALPAELLESIFEKIEDTSEYFEVMKGLVQSPNCTDSLLQKIIDKTPEQGPYFWCRIPMLKQCSPETLKKLVKACKEGSEQVSEILTLVAGRLVCPDDVLQEIAKESDGRFRADVPEVALTHILIHPNAQPETIVIALEKYPDFKNDFVNGFIRCSLAKKTSSNKVLRTIIEQIISHKGKKVNYRTCVFPIEDKDRVELMLAVTNNPNCRADTLKLIQEETDDKRILDTIAYKRGELSGFKGVWIKLKDLLTPSTKKQPPVDGTEEEDLTLLLSKSPLLAATTFFNRTHGYSAPENKLSQKE